MNSSAFLFPGQGAQYIGMGKDFFDAYPESKECFQEADDLLGMFLSKIIFEGPEETLTRTDHSQLAIFVTSVAMLKIVQKLSGILPKATAGLSLGEYTALFAAGKIDFASCLKLVERRGKFMSEACDHSRGMMAVLLGLDGQEVEKKVQSLELLHDLWVANFNCPGQVVVSGTAKGMEVLSQAAPSWGVKRVIPLKVHGAFHSGLMTPAQKNLAPYITAAPMSETSIQLFMNVPGKAVSTTQDIQRYLTDQVTMPVRFEQCIRAMMNEGIETFIEIGPGTTLSGMLKKIIVPKSLNIAKVEDLKKICL